MEGYKTLEETWREEVGLNRHIAGCRVEIYGEGGTPFDELMRERLRA
jgi:hypothetical protein